MYIEMRELTTNDSAQRVGSKAVSEPLNSRLRSAMLGDRTEERGRTLIFHSYCSFSRTEGGKRLKGTPSLKLFIKLKDFLFHLYGRGKEKIWMMYHWKSKTSSQSFSFILKILKV